MPGPVLEERRRLTIFFADLSGFTRLSSDLDPEEVREAVNICFEQLNIPIVEQGGTIHKYEGDLIMALFGFPEGHEDDPERAVKTAIAMLALMPGINERLKSRLKITNDVGLHIGINAGLVVVGEIGSSAKRELTVMGDAVNLASRLNDAAENGEILVSETVYRQTKYLIDYETRPAIAVKGKPDPVRIYMPRGLKTIPGSKRGIAGLSSPMVGRDRESEMLVNAARDLLGKKPRVVFVSGEAGLGKTRLLTEFKDYLARERPEIMILEGICFPYTANVPYGPITQMLKQALGIRDNDPAHVVIERIRRQDQNEGDDIVPYLRMLLAVALEEQDQVRIRYLEGKDLQQQIWRAVKKFLSGLERPSILFIDDFHWIDPESLSFLDFLWVSRPVFPFLTVVLSRPERESKTWQTAQRWRDKPDIDLRPIDLRPLDENSTGALFTNLLSATGADTTRRDRILERCAGNPFYLEEIIKALIEQQVIRPGSDALPIGSGGNDIDIPESLQALLTSRLDRLEPTARDALLAASVIGRIFDIRILEAICPEDETSFALNLTILENSGFVRIQPGAGPVEYSFTHPLFQEAAYQRLLKKQRRELHRRIGAAAEIIYADRLETQTDFLARHYGFGDDDEKAILWLGRAADRAQKDFANEEAIGYYLALIERFKVTGTAGLGGVYETLGDLAVLKSDFPAAFDYYQRMFEASQEKVDRVRSRRKSAEVHYKQGRFDDALAALSEAEERVKGETEVENFELAEIDVDRCWVYHLKGDLVRAVEIGQQSLVRIERLASTGRDREVMLLKSRTYSNLGSIYSGRGEFAAAEASYQAGLDLAIKVDDQRGIAIAQNNLGIIASQQGQQARAAEYFRVSNAIAERIGDRQSVAIARCNLGMVYNFQGKYEPALGEFQAYLQTSEEIGDRRCQEIAHVNLGTVRQKQQRFEEALDHFSKACVLGEEIGDKQNLNIAFLNIGTILRDRGEFDRGREYFEKSKRLAEEIGDRIGTGMADGYQGESLRRQKKLKEAKELVERFRSIMEELDYRSGMSIALYYLGLIETDAGNRELADDYFDKAGKLAEESGDTDWIRTIRSVRQNPIDKTK